MSTEGVLRVRRLSLSVLGCAMPMLLAASLFLCGETLAADRDPLVKLLIKKGVITEEEVRGMEAELAAARVAEGKKVAEAKPAEKPTEEKPRVELANALSKLKMKGRWAAGYFKSQEGGSYPEGSFEVPEAKLQFAFQPDDTYAIVMRGNFNNAAFNSLDYLYVDASDPFKLPKGWLTTLNARFGRFKLDFGEETWSNNPVESALPSNSAGNVAGSDEGLQLSGKVGKGWPAVTWATAVSNGSSGVSTDTTQAKAFTGKLGMNPIAPLLLSASYHRTGSLKQQATEVGIAGLTGKPTGASNWRRSLWELDARYDFKKGKTLTPAYTDSLAYLRGAYGAFNDDVRDGAEREGDYGFVEGLLNVLPKVYLAARYSRVDLDGRQTASLNSVTANSHERYSLGAGYRWSPNTIFKTEYSINRTTQVTGGDPDDNQAVVLIASQF